MSLTKAQQKAVEAVLSSKTLGEAAEKSGVSARTLYTWRRLEAFREALRDMQRDAMGIATTRLARASASAVDALERVLADVNAPAAAVVSAAKAVLDSATRALELEDLAARLEKLEQQNTPGDNAQQPTTH